MTDYAGFLYGGAQYPLQPAVAGSPLLKDADPALFYLLEFYQSILTTHLQERFLAEVAASGVDNAINSIVGETLPLNPEPYLTEAQIHWPLLAGYRKSTRFLYEGQKKLSRDEYDIVFALPALQVGEADRLMPILRSVVAVIDNRTEQGSDPNYTPTGGTLGQQVWVLAGVSRAEVKSVSYGGYAPTSDLYFPAVVIGLELWENSDPNVLEFGDFTGADVEIDLKDDDGTVVSHVSDFQTNPAPSLVSASPNTGTKQGGTVVTLTGTGFVVGTTPIVTFDGLPAAAVAVLSSTQVRCTTPAHDAFTTFAADIVIKDIEGLSATLAAGFTFTSP